LIEFAAPATMAPAERQSMLATRARVERFTTGYSISRELYSQPVWLMFALTAVLLLLACLNLGGLLLSRAMARAQEIAMKLALGSGRWRIARQVVIENLVLSVGGALLAIPVTFGLVAVIVSLMPEVLTVAGTRFTPDAFVIAATSVVGVAAGFVISILPIWMAGSARAFISVGVNRTVAPATAHWTRVLVVAQVAMSMALVVGAGLLGRSLYRLQQADTGIRAEGVSVARLRPLPNAYNTLNYAAYYPPLFEAIAALPGVQSAGYSRGFPSGVLHLFPGEVAAFVGDPDGNIRAHFEAVSPGFFETLGASLLRGRLFTWADNEKSPPIAVVTEQLARQLQPDGSVVGRRIRVGAIPLNQNVEIVGVVRNITMGHSRRTDLPMVFRPGLQIPLYARYPSFVIRHDTQALTGIAAGLRDIAAKGGREFLHDIRPLPDLLERAPASERMSAAVAMTLAALAAVLAFVGVFGVLAYAVSRRTREIGVRAAVGAAPASVMWMVMREGALLAAIGVAIGIPAAYYGSRLLSSLTFGVSPVDPLTFASAAVFLVVLGVGAGLVPARRAARIDPVIALRAE
jgi:predicted permease